MHHSEDQAILTALGWLKTKFGAFVGFFVVVVLLSFLWSANAVPLWYLS